MKPYIYLVLLGCDHINWTYPISAIVGLNSVCHKIVSYVTIVFYDKVQGMGVNNYILCNINIVIYLNSLARMDFSEQNALRSPF
jgi:hypothetical protein